jgi:3-hydroxyisobutyrate dehydrogenase-like beta-hydroxyacid dehydrogenase
MSEKSSDATLKAGILGYGEVGTILSTALRERGLAWVGVWDVLFRDSSQSAAMKSRAMEAGVEACTSLAALLARSDIVISAVTAARAVEVAREAAASIRAGTFFLDLNSASPAAKAEAAELIDGAGAHYVEAGVMASVPPYGLGVPMLLGGRHAGALARKLMPLGFDMTVVADEIGVASAIKMCRSVFIKGLEAIVVESYTLARRHGVERQLLASLAQTYPEIDWEKQGSYLFSRVAKHGKRRAEEMREAANTVREAGLDPSMSTATAETQDRVAAFSKSAQFGDLGPEQGWRAYADKIIAALKNPVTAAPKRSGRRS